ncbi:ABC transporter ATP-binding protein [Aureispira anguillae]|uniref:ABC transporter ATP-binding protein/permease n=1 Tax=Aureispira anguillae TaxID=2864201 RepID=A0A916DW70_9BACT|nr:ABC transporter ATP-binding protein [Aureispira anguillae]BDS14502.1 ABC transporter ATP-binding protein/permease [Aureispira anguillae]
MQKFYQLWGVLGQWKNRYLIAGLLLTFSSLVRMLEPKVIQIAIDGVVEHFATTATHQEPDFLVYLFYAVLPTNNSDNLHWFLFCLGVLLVSIVAIKALSWFTANIIVADSTEKAIKAFRDRLFAHIQSLSLSQMSKIPTGELIQRCTGDIGTIQKFIGTQISELIRLAAIATGAFAMMWMVHPSYALISIALFVPIILTSYFFFKKEQTVWEEHENEQDKLTAIIQENLAGIRVVQAFAEEENETHRFAAQNKAKRTIGVRHIDLHMLFWPFSDWLVNVQIALSLFAGGYYALLGEITVGEYTSFFAYAVMVTWPMRNLGRIVSQLGMAGVAMERITQILEAETEDYNLQPAANSEEQLGEIEFRNVWFAYPNANKTTTGKWALQDVSFNVNLGEKLAIMGSTGAGKSTIIALLLRFYEPDDGLILLNGKPLTSYDKVFLRQQFGVVLQKPFLFSTSIRENIAYARKNIHGQTQLSQQTDVSEEDLESVADDACVTDFIHKMSAGYETLVGEKGVTLSGGQKQRVALARTLLSDPAILVLDDATSAVDTETEFKMQQALNKRMKGKTTFIIAHRLTSIQDADKILVLTDGKVLELGTHKELLKNKSFYREVYDIQSSIEDSIQ